MNVIGNLDRRYSKMIRVLLHEPKIKTQAYIAPRSSSHDGTSHHRRASTMKVRGMSSGSVPGRDILSVIFYGSMEVFETVGRFFSQCSEYLQTPLRCDRNVPYRNPQSLLGREDNAIMTNHFRSEISSSDIEMLAQDENPSVLLESRNCYSEMEPPAAIRTSLYRCVVDDVSQRMVHFRSIAVSD